MAINEMQIMLQSISAHLKLSSAGLQTTRAGVPGWTGEAVIPRIWAHGIIPIGVFFYWKTHFIVFLLSSLLIQACAQMGKKYVIYIYTVKGNSEIW